LSKLAQARGTIIFQKGDHGVVKRKGDLTKKKKKAKRTARKEKDPNEPWRKTRHWLVKTGS